MPLVESLILNQNVDFTEIETEQESIAQNFSHIDRKVEQSQDPDIARVATLLSIGQGPTAQQAEHESFEVKDIFEIGIIMNWIMGFFIEFHHTEVSQTACFAYSLS